MGIGLTGRDRTVTIHTVTYSLSPEDAHPMVTWWPGMEDYNLRIGMSSDSWRPDWESQRPRAWSPDWEVWVSSLSISGTRTLQYAFLHLLRYDRSRGPVPITSTTRFFMRYDTPGEWQGSREEFLWCIEQYVNWLAPVLRYGCLTEWTAWAAPAMFT